MGLPVTPVQLVVSPLHMTGQFARKFLRYCGTATPIQRLPASPTHPNPRRILPSVQEYVEQAYGRSDHYGLFYGGGGSLLASQVRVWRGRRQEGGRMYGG